MSSNAFIGKPPGFASVFNIKRRHRADQDRFGHAFCAVAPNVTRDFAAAGGMTDVDCILQIERLDQLRQIVRVCVHVVPGPRLARPAVPAPIVRNAAVAALRQKKHLIFKSIRAQRPAMTEDHGLSGSPIIIIDVDVSSVFFPDRDV